VNQAVLLLAHGAPERLEDVEPYLGFVRGGRPANPQVTEEVRHRYAAIGGGSPLLRWTRAQAAALEALLGLPAHFAMRNWRPFIQDVVPKIEASRVAAVCLAPQYSEMSVGLYMRKVAETNPPFEISWARSYHDEPLLIEAFAGRIGNPGPRVLFTAHSLPERALAKDDPYDRECRATAALVAARLGLADWDFAYQSQGMTGDRWLGPSVESCLDRYAAEGLREVTIAPIGFVCDHVEVLYDIDILFRDYAAARGITVRRPESLNDSPRFTEALAKVVHKCLE
jgi:protoporphyrin/coproporphyrin ferrochelatase